MTQPKGKTMKRLTHEQAAARDNYCPNCGIISYDPKPMVYTCPRCETEGYDCCIAGQGVLCFKCEESGHDD